MVNSGKKHPEIVLFNPILSMLLLRHYGLSVPQLRHEFQTPRLEWTFGTFVPIVAIQRAFVHVKDLGKNFCSHGAQRPDRVNDIV